MTKKSYAISDPMHGMMHFVETEQEAKDKFFELLFNFALPYFGEHPYVEITTNEDGTDTWKNVDGNEITNVMPEGTMEERFAQLRSQVTLMRAVDNHDVTKARPHTGEFGKKFVTPA